MRKCAELGMDPYRAGVLFMCKEAQASVIRANRRNKVVNNPGFGLGASAGDVVTASNADFASDLEARQQPVVQTDDDWPLPEETKPDVSPFYEGEGWSDAAGTAFDERTAPTFRGVPVWNSSGEIAHDRNGREITSNGITGVYGGVNNDGGIPHINPDFEYDAEPSVATSVGRFPRVRRPARPVAWGPPVPGTPEYIEYLRRTGQIAKLQALQNGAP